MSIFYKITNSPTSRWFPLKEWNEKYDIWSLLSDFFFLFGVFVLDWNPILLIAYFMIDTAAMSVFAIILFYKEKKDWIHTIGFVFAVLIVLACMLGIYSGVLQFIDDLDKLHIPVEQIDFSHLFNPIVIPLILSFSGLTHYAEYQEDIRRMREGTYSSSFIKHFGMRYLLVNGLVLIMVLSYSYYNISVVLGLLIIKTFIRLVNKKYRKIL